MKVICEFWCSPLRSEIYTEKFIVPDTFDVGIITEIKEDYIGLFGNFWWDVFGEEHQTVGGLWKVVCSVEVKWRNFHDWEGCPDCEVDFDVDVIFKSKCSHLSELKYVWMEIRP